MTRNDLTMRSSEHLPVGGDGQPQITRSETREISPLIRKRTSNPIVFIERDYQGKVRVWTKPGAEDQSVAYVVRLEGGR